ncbi:hypothetical protein [Thermococcus sp.]|uniref:hypothetical protein n=1 Tax=Thermococcus sp. TaxID=35749 RepID=UPI00263129F1|nr:hypothetical protein [Thermococcus sp.]MCD6143940.1 hypothetical protein [Thermococcus sp.]
MAINWKSFSWKELERKVKEFYRVLYEENFARKNRVKILWECDFPEDKLQELEKLFEKFQPDEYEKRIKDSFFVKKEIPFLEAVYLVYIGWKGYKEGAFWEYTIFSDSNSQNKSGQRFLDFLKKHQAKGLKLFNIKGSYKYVNNIIFHCGIPKVYINHLFQGCLKIYKDIGIEIRHLKNEDLAHAYFSSSPKTLRTFVKEGEEVSKGLMKRILESFYVYEDSPALFDKNLQDLPRWIFGSLSIFIQKNRTKVARKRICLAFDEFWGDEAYLKQNGKVSTLEDLSNLYTGYGTTDFLLFNEKKKLVRPYDFEPKTKKLILREEPKFIVCKTELEGNVGDYIVEEYKIQGKLGEYYKCFKLEDFLETEVADYSVKVTDFGTGINISGERIPEYISLKYYPSIPVYMGKIGIINDDMFNKIDIYNYRTGELIEMDVENLPQGGIYRIVALGGWGEEKEAVFGLISKHTFRLSSRGLYVDNELRKNTFVLDGLDFISDIERPGIFLKDTANRIREVLLFEELDSIRLCVETLPKYCTPTKIKIRDDKQQILDRFVIRQRQKEYFFQNLGNIVKEKITFPLMIECFPRNLENFPIGIITDKPSIEEGGNYWSICLGVDQKAKIVLYSLSEIWNEPKTYEFEDKIKLSLPDDLPQPRQGDFLIKIYIGNFEFYLEKNRKNFGHYKLKDKNLLQRLAKCFTQPYDTACINRVKLKTRDTKTILKKLPNVPYPYLDDGILLPLNSLLSKLLKDFKNEITAYVENLDEEQNLKEKLKLCVLFDIYEFVKTENVFGPSLLTSIDLNRKYEEIEHRKFYDYMAIIDFRKKLTHNLDLRAVISNMLKENEEILNKIAVTTDYGLLEGNKRELRDINNVLNNILLILEGLSIKTTNIKEKEGLKKLLWRLIEIDPGLVKIGIIYWRELNETIKSA